MAETNPNKSSSFEEHTSKTEPNNIIPVYNLSFIPNGSKPYNPLTNYTSQRPEFLRFNPNQRKEILLSINQETRSNKEVNYEKWSCLKRTFKTVYLLACLVFSVYLILLICSNKEFELDIKGSETNRFLSEIIGLSNMCLNRDYVEFTCGIEEREYYIENKPIIMEIIHDLNGFVLIENTSFSSDSSDIGLLAQENTDGEFILNNISSNLQLDELPKLELHVLQNAEVPVHRAMDLKKQVYLLYSLEILAFFSIFIGLVTSLKKYIIRKLCKNPKPGIKIPDFDFETKKDILDLGRLENEKIDQRPVLIEKNNEFSGFLPPQVELLAEFSFGETNKENSNLVKEFEKVLNKRNLNFSEATKENMPIGFNNNEEIKEQKEMNKIEITPLRRSSRIRTKITSP